MTNFTCPKLSLMGAAAVSAAAIAAVVSCAAAPLAERVPIAQVYKRPEAFDGRRVVLTGVLIVGERGGALYDFVTTTCGYADNAAAIEIDEHELAKLFRDLGKKNFTKVTLAGTFRNLYPRSYYERPRRNRELKGGLVVTTLDASGPGPLRDVTLLKHSGYVEGCE